MNTTAISSVALATIITGVGVVLTGQASAVSLANGQERHDQKLATTKAKATGTAESPDRTLMAQLFYPSVSDRQGLMVQGQGTASAPADAVRIEFQLTNLNPYEVIEGDPNATAPPSSTTHSEPKPITQAALKPVVDALVAQGVSPSAIEVNTSFGSSSSFSFPYPSPTGASAAQILVTFDSPTRERVQEIVTVVSESKTLGEDLTIQAVNVSYQVNDCQSLEKAAYVAAVNDARNRANALSEALSVRIADVPSIAESPFAGLVPSTSSSSCNSQGGSLAFPFNGLQQPYNPAAPAAVEVKKDIFATYAIRQG